MIKSPLSAREQEVLRYYAEGLTTEQIASKLILTPATVTRYMARARKKLGALTSAHAILIVVRLFPTVLTGAIAQHGTPRAVAAHEDNDTPLCEACEAYAEVPEELAGPTQGPYRRLTPPAQRLKRGSFVQCGTIQAANRHIRNKDRINDLTCGCREAYLEWWRDYQRGRTGVDRLAG